MSEDLEQKEIEHLLENGNTGMSKKIPSSDSPFWLYCYVKHHGDGRISYELKEEYTLEYRQEGFEMRVDEFDKRWKNWRSWDDALFWGGSCGAGLTVLLCIIMLIRDATQ